MDNAAGATAAAPPADHTAAEAAADAPPAAEAVAQGDAPAHADGSAAADAAAPAAGAHSDARDARPADLPEDVESPRKIFVGSLPPHTREEDLRTLFASCGTVERVEPKGTFAFVVRANALCCSVCAAVSCILLVAFRSSSRTKRRATRR